MEEQLVQDRATTLEAQDKKEELRIWGSVENRKQWEQSKLYAEKPKKVWKTSDLAWLTVVVAVLIIIALVIYAVQS